MEIIINLRFRKNTNKGKDLYSYKLSYVIRGYK